MLLAFLMEDVSAGGVGAADVAGVRGSLFGRSNKRFIDRSPAGRIPIIKFKNNWTMKLSRYYQQSMVKEDLDAESIISQLQSNHKRMKDIPQSTAMFGLLDDHGETIRVTVSREQAQDFEHALSQYMSSDTHSRKEIAEILFELRNKFNIIDVVYPRVQEDEEPAQVRSDDDTDDSNDHEIVDIDDDSSEDSIDLDNLSKGDDSSDMGEIKTTLDQIVKMLMSDVEARRADAEARAAEARAKEAESAARIAELKMRGEEQVLDAESYFKTKKQEKREADKIKMLARYRQETSPQLDDNMDYSEVNLTGPKASVPTEIDLSASHYQPKQWPAIGIDKQENEEMVTIPKSRLLAYLKSIR